MLKLHKLITTPVTSKNWPEVFEAIKAYVGRHPASVSKKNDYGFSAYGMMILSGMPAQYAGQLKAFLSKHYEPDDEERKLVQTIICDPIFEDFARETHTLLTAMRLSSKQLCLYEAPKPEHIMVDSQEVKLTDLEETCDFCYRDGLIIPKALKQITNPLHLNLSVDRRLLSSALLELKTLPHAGLSTLSRGAIEAGSQWLYVGETFRMTSNSSSRYAVQIAASKSGTSGLIVDAQSVGGMARFMPHLPASTRLYDIKFCHSSLTMRVATANVSLSGELYAGEPCCLWVEATRHIRAKEIVGWDYGEQFWSTSATAPALFDRRGRLIPASLYDSRLNLRKVYGDSEVYTARIMHSEILRCVRQNESLQVKIGPRDVVFTPEEIREQAESQGLIPQRYVSKNKPEKDLRAACRAGDFMQVLFLLDWSKHTLDVNAANSKGWTPLHLAAAKGHFYVAVLLLTRNADASKTTNKGATPRMLAVQKCAKTQDPIEREEYEDMVSILTR